MKKLIVATLTVCALLLSSMTVHAQFKNGKYLLGPHIGFSQYGSTIAFGGMFEAPVTHPNDVGPGIIGISGQVMYYHWTWDTYSNYGASDIVIGVYGNYHILLDDRKLDPFAGIGFVYEHFSFDGSNFSYNSGLGLGVQVGLRYFFSPNVAGRIMLGNAASFFTAGVDFGL
jgi:hypothetical protein